MPAYFDSDPCLSRLTYIFNKISNAFLIENLFFDWQIDFWIDKKPKKNNGGNQEKTGQIAKSGSADGAKPLV